MPNITPRESIETVGLIAVRHSTGLTPQGRARDAAGLPTSAADEGPTEEAFELHDSETRQSVIDSLRKAAEDFRPGQSRRWTLDGEIAMEVCDLLLSFADRVEQIDETVGELLARTGWQEGDELRIRAKTPQEEIEPVVRELSRKGLAVLEAAKADRSLHTFDGPRPEPFRLHNGELIDDPAPWPEGAEA